MTFQSARMKGSPRADQLGKYRLVATLGQGGMGTVYLALASGLGQFRKLLVVKELRQDLTCKDGFVTMFMDEARLAARLEHPNVVQTFEVDQDAERYFLAMEYLDGQPLSTLLECLKDTGRMPLWFHLHILCEVLAGLQYAHELKDYDGSSLHVVHRDISPQNVFLTYHGQVKVVDFGVAKASNATVLTDPGIFKGKFAYAAPEQIMGRPVDARTDLFSVGVMLWQAIAGRRFSVQQPTRTSFRARVGGHEPRIREVVPDVNPILAAICDQALAIDPEDRFASAEAFRIDLQEYLEVCDARVDAAQIGQLMRSTFEAERRAIHQVIEQAMKHSDPSSSLVASLQFLHREDEKYPTAVADLSSLVDVSNETDDEKIRQGYAHSKITSLRTPVLSFRPARVRRSLLLAIVVACSGLAALTGALWQDQRSATPPVVTELPETMADPRLPVRVTSNPGVQPAQVPSDPRTGSVGEAEQAAGDRDPASTAVGRRESELKRRQSAAIRRERQEATRAAALSGSQKPQLAGTARRDAPLQARSRTLDAGVEMGSDLRVLRRRAIATIDAEDPYR